jgi:N,N'-diacetyllegionaminate synthase
MEIKTTTGSGPKKSMRGEVSEGRCYIIAEIGGNFTTFDQAKRLVDEAFACRVDAVKLQTYRAETVSSRKAMFDMENTGTVSQYDLFRRYEINEDLHKEVFHYIDSLGLDWFSTPAHETDVELLDRLGAMVHKIGSDDAVNIPFLKYVARKGKPIILSTGMCTLQEVRDSVSAILEEGNNHISLLHCTTSYPTHPEHVNLMAMKTLMREFPEFAVGYSDHTVGTTACICAAAMGARLIEKHFTYDKEAEGPDHMLSADPLEMKEIVGKIREFEIMRGDGIKRPSESERTNRINNRKSVVLESPVREGACFTREALAVKRPGYGVQPKYFDQVLGKRANRDLEKDDVLMWGDFG